MARDGSSPYAGEESPTPAKNVRLLLYQRLLAIIDELFRCEPSATTDYIEIGELYADASPELRAAALRVCRAILRSE